MTVDGSPLVIAHRGASFHERENTLTAFERAIQLGADLVELDVQVSRDGALVVFHDLELDRLTPVSGPLRRRDATELRALGIPTLEEALEVMRGRVGVLADLKGAWLYRRHDLPQRVAALLGPDDAVAGFQPRALLEAHRARPELRVLQHLGCRVSIRRAARYAWAAGFHDRRVTKRGLALAQRLGLATVVYTVNDARRMRALAELGVDGIVSDRVDVLRAVVDTR